MESSELRPHARPKDHQVAISPIKIVVSDDLPASALELLRAEPGWQVDARSGRPPAELAAALADADGLLVRSATKVTADLIAAAPRLRIVARAGTGVDTSMSPPPADGGSWWSTRRVRTASASPSTRAP